MSESRAKEVAELLESENARIASEITERQIRTWMKSDDVDLKSTLYSYLCKESSRQKIAPTISHEEFLDFSLDLFGECLRKDLDNIWALSRYEAGWEIVRFFFQNWNGGANSEFVSKVNDWLSVTYLGSSLEIQECLVNATLEHLFENEMVARAFENWKDIKGLDVAYADAMRWVNEGGDSPLSKT